MKVFAAMFCAAMVFAFTGCSKDLEKEIVGSWRWESTTITETIQGQSHTETDTPDEGESTIFTFNEDNTCSETVTYEGQTFTTTGTYSLNGDQLTIQLQDQDEPSTSTVDIDGSDMTLTYTESYGEASIKMVAKMKKI